MEVTYEAGPDSEKNWGSCSDSIQWQDWQHAHSVVLGVSNMFCNFKLQCSCKVEKKMLQKASALPDKCVETTYVH